MDGHGFDGLAKKVGRRGLLGLLAGVALPGAAGAGKEAKQRKRGNEDKIDKKEIGRCRRSVTRECPTAFGGRLERACKKGLLGCCEHAGESKRDAVRCLAGARLGVCQQAVKEFCRLIPGEPDCESTFGPCCARSRNLVEAAACIYG